MLQNERSRILRMTQETFKEQKEGKKDHGVVTEHSQRALTEDKRKGFPGVRNK